jgi:hypothetical protein
VDALPTAQLQAALAQLQESLASLEAEWNRLRGGSR